LATKRSTIERLVAPFGTVQDAQFHDESRNSNSSLTVVTVQMASSREVVRAISCLDGKKVFGHPITVQLSLSHHLKLRGAASQGWKTIGVQSSVRIRGLRASACVIRWILLFFPDRAFVCSMYNDNVVGAGSSKYDNAYFEINYVRAYTTGLPGPTSSPPSMTPLCWLAATEITQP
jgi:RNA recognition motif. (a.k.a. RRM, RBD, or RNP domain)